MNANEREWRNTILTTKNTKGTKKYNLTQRRKSAKNESFFNSACRIKENVLFISVFFCGLCAFALNVPLLTFRVRWPWRNNRGRVRCRLRRRFGNWRPAAAANRFPPDNIFSPDDDFSGWNNGGADWPWRYSSVPRLPPAAHDRHCRNSTG